MKIKEILSQTRRDFNALYICDHCGNEETSGGYDDMFFHTEVIPAMICKKCGKRAKDTYVPRATKYLESITI